MELWKKHWTTALGALFVLAAFLSLFKYSADQGWLTDPIKIAIGLIAGAAAASIGVKLHRKGKGFVLAGELGTGLGAAIGYSTAAYAGIYTTLWESMTVLVAMTAITAAVAAYAYRFNSRILMMVSLLGSMLAPLVMQPETDQVLQLFLYLLVMNTAVFAISVMKSWLELRLTAFLFTWLLYAVYYVHFLPESNGWWSMPMRYAVAAFVFYLVAFYAATWRDRSQSAGINVYFSFANTVLFGAWAAALLPGQGAMTVLMLLIGVLYGMLALAIYRFKMVSVSAAAGHIHAALAVIALLLGMSGLGSGSDYRPLVGAFVWTAIALAMVLVGRKLRTDWLIVAGSFVWLVTGVYWFANAWDVPRINPLGDLYIPFLNGGAIAWVALAAFGFYVSRQVNYKSLDKESASIVAVLYAVLSHIIVGGLLTVQITNVYDEYDVAGSVQLALSVAWGVYALLLFLWGAYSRQRPFRWFGSIVIVLVALKTILLDLSGESSLYKIIVFLLLGAISFGISWVNTKWQAKSGKQ
ncbi:hypothetical protein PaecuDRAFT_1273 [Paenibacillus curdlanolyticus YK9]|uniref:DUF2339 domain-containing protein n=1 Tax=Paenibacillus curdlanolyticus YK9 TaxID=717606 RepID=E0I6K1_9BACL|nr:DUF2339 domain-containing protein [Paenibacillus curdlanolyticus]EFM11667.1 hypothetical protein PaecuDRAFT_1273 [Paenibacillus curdlanolyticus YK9]